MLWHCKMIGACAHSVFECWRLVGTRPQTVAACAVVPPQSERQGKCRSRSCNAVVRQEEGIDRTFLPFLSFFAAMVLLLLQLKALAKAFLSGTTSAQCTVRRLHWRALSTVNTHAHCVLKLILTMD